MLRQMMFTLAALAGMGMASARQSLGQLSDADRKGIQAVTDTWLKAMRSGDSSGVAATYTEDGMLLPPNQSVVKGREAIRHYLGQFPKILAFNVTLSEIEGQGNLAYTRGTYDVTTAPAAGQKNPGKESGKFIEIRRKEPDGSWLILRDFWNSNHPPGR
jgi:uncharacterized protein (TIGR02246 family)